MEYEDNKREVRLYIENAQEMLAAARVNLDHNFYASSVNRSYYAVFYAANALLATLGEARSKHSGVISMFRQRFIKTGELPAELSEIYGDLMNSRQSGDYDINTRIEMETAEQLLEKARRFVNEVEQWLQRNQWL
ncbi:MAG: HEPN domain-containing protein [Candidatus Villigracilaceae bacterium]